MKRILLSLALASTLTPLQARASEPIYIVNGKATSINTAVLTLLREPKSEVFKCVQQDIKLNKTGVSLKKKGE